MRILQHINHPDKFRQFAVAKETFKTLKKNQWLNVKHKIQRLAAISRKVSPVRYARKFQHWTVEISFFSALRYKRKSALILQNSPYIISAVS